MDIALDFYGPWLQLLLALGLPLLLIGTPATFLLKRGSPGRWLMGRIALLGWALAISSVALRVILGVLQDAFAGLPGM